jgi:genome maintenance exonuclease 1
MIFQHNWLPKIEMKRVTDEQTGKRLYTTPEGKRYPSVTTVLSQHSAAGIQAWRARVGEAEANRISSYAAKRGTRIHALCESFLKNEPVVIENPVHREMFESLKPELEKIDNVRALEHGLYSNYLRLAGTVDCIADYRGRPCVIDFKTSRKLKNRDQIQSYFMQTSAYAIMAEERHGLSIPWMVILIMVDDSAPQVFIEHRDDWADCLLEYRDMYETGLKPF